MCHRSSGKIIQCSYCDQQFVIHHHCYRNHKYCCDWCRRKGYELRRKLARRKYADSEEARLDHNDRQRRYRDENKGKDQKIFQSMLDKTSIKDPEIIKPDLEFCIVCRQRVTFVEGYPCDGEMPT